LNERDSSLATNISTQESKNYDLLAHVETQREELLQKGILINRATEKDLPVSNIDIDQRHL